MNNKGSGFIWKYTIYCLFFLFFLNKILYPLSLTNDEKFVQKETYCIIKYNNIIYNYENKIINIPIFNGTGDDVLYTDLLKKQKFKYSILSNIAIPINEKNAKKTLLRMLKFYKNNLFLNVDINRPTGIALDQDVWYIYYNFDYEKIPCNMLVIIGVNEENANNLLKRKNISDIIISEMEFYNNIEYFLINFSIGKYREP